MPARVDFAWRCHAAQENWASKVDTKASIFLTANLVGLAALLSTRSGPDGSLRALEGWHRFGVDGGTLLGGLAALATVMVIFPLLGPRRRPVQQDTIYFGHLRDRSPDGVARQIASLTAEEQVDQLARQLVVMAKTNWIKHRILQLALLLALVGYTVIGLSLAT